MPGGGRLNLTGQLGDVMRESAMAAHSIIRGRTAGKHKYRRELANTDIHVHVPAGATPKDGPSAGVAMLTAMMSVLTGQVVDPATGMTGEITLSGRVLPVGGVREKVLAAHRAGLTRVLLPARNEQDLAEVPADVRESIEFVLIGSIDELLDVVFKERKPATRARAQEGDTQGKEQESGGLEGQTGEVGGHVRCRSRPRCRGRPRVRRKR